MWCFVVAILSSLHQKRSAFKTMRITERMFFTEKKIVNDDNDDDDVDDDVDYEEITTH